MYQSTNDLAHRWAQQSHDSTDSEKSSNCYYQGPELISYSTVIACNYPGFALFTSNKYSISTSTLQNYAKEASWRKWIEVPHVSRNISKENHQKNWNHLINEIMDVVKKYSKRKLSIYPDQITKRIGNAKFYLENFPLVNKMVSKTERMLLESAIDQTQAIHEQWKKANDAAAKRAEQKILKQKQDRINKLNENLIKWKADEYDGRELPNTSTTYLRITVDKHETIVESTLGLKFSLKDCKRIWKFIKSVVKKKADWHSNGVKLEINGYQINEITASGMLHAGCHHIPYEELLATAQKLGIE